MPARPRDERRFVARYVTGCQQVLALAVVLVALAPAAGVVSMDVAREPGDTATTGGSQTPVAALSAYTRETERPSPVPAHVVDPVVSEFSLTTPANARIASHVLAGRERAGRLGTTVVTSRPQAVHGYGTVGVTWQHGDDVAERDIAFSVRTERHGVWSTWTSMDYHAEHGPDPGSVEARHARPGTDEALIGHVARVQVRIVSSAGAPADMKLAVIDPGTAPTRLERPAIDTGRLSTDPTAAPDQMAPATPVGARSGSGGVSLSAAAYTPKPKIYSRAQWGADESMREKDSLHYFEVHAGFVHHTVNANDYTRAEVPALIRSIYAYHTQSKGWSDIGYNFLVDRFGRIWEGRYGGVDRPVVGAHTKGYNDYSFAMSAIGDYDVAEPSQAMVQAYAALFAWKLSLHGVSAASTSQRVGTRTFQAINGHRDAGQTACPGRYLYAKLPEIRTLAAAAQKGWSGRGPESDQAGTPYPDLIVRRASDGQGFLIPTGGLIAFSKPTTGVAGWGDATSVVASPDLTGDHRADLLVSGSDGSVSISAGGSRGAFGARTRSTSVFDGHDLLTAVGDLDGDGHNDVVAREVSTGRLDVYDGDGAGGFASHTLSGSVWHYYDLLAATGDLTGDGHADLVGRTPAGVLYLHPGNGHGGFGKRIRVAGDWSGLDTITGFGDYTGDGLPDLIVRVADTGSTYVVPGHGDGTFGHALGPDTWLRGLTGITGAGQVSGNSAPDLIARSGDRLVVVANRGTVNLSRAIPTGVDLSTADLILDAGDWDRDGHGDMITRNHTTGALWLRRGDGMGHYGDQTLLGRGFGSVGLLASVGDVTGDGYPDLMGQPKGGDMMIYPGRSVNGLGAPYPAYHPIDATQQVGLGLWDGDGAPDSAFRTGNTLTLYPGNGPGGLTGHSPMHVDVSDYDWIIGVSDVRLSGHADLIVRTKDTHLLYLLPGTATGVGAPRLLGQGMGGFDLAG